MGLDMNLYRKHYLTGDERTVVEDTLKIKAPRYVISEVAYWRKAYEIHEWFILNCYNDVENCRVSYIDYEKLLDLLNKCKTILAAKHAKGANKIASKLLPDPDGEYGEWYWENIEETVKQLSVIEDDCSDDDYYYIPWW